MKPLSGRQEPENPRLASLDTLCVTSARKRKKRAYHRIMSGLAAAGSYKFLTLTSSSASPDDIQRSWRKLVMRLQRRGLLKDGYIRITERTHAGRPHYHVIFRGSYLDQAWISHLWEICHEAPVVYVSQVRSKRGIASYLGKYLVKEMQGRLSWSCEWLYKGFVKAWYELKKLGRLANVPRYRVLTYWQSCCKLKKKPWEVITWEAKQSYEKLLVKSAGRHTAELLAPSLLRQFILTI